MSIGIDYICDLLMTDWKNLRTIKESYEIIDLDKPSVVVRPGKDVPVLQPKRQHLLATMNADLRERELMLLERIMNDHEEELNELREYEALIDGIKER